MSKLSDNHAVLIARYLSTSTGRVALAKAIAKPIRMRMFGGTMPDNCPACGSNKLNDSHFLVLCMECGLNGPTGGTNLDAVLKWNHAAGIYGKLEVKDECPI